MAFQENEEEVRWFVMRDLKRTNAKLPAYKLLDGKKMEVFVPMKWHLVTRKGVRVREEVRSYKTCSSCMRHGRTLTLL